MEEGVQSHVIWSYKEHIKPHNTDAEYPVAEFMNVVCQQRVHEMGKSLSRDYKTIYLPHY